jgi:hypothetical protein
MLPSDALRACLQTLLESEDSVELTEALKRDLASHEPGPAVAACLLHTLEACGDLPEQQKVHGCPSITASPGRPLAMPDTWQHCRGQQQMPVWRHS